MPCECWTINENQMRQSSTSILSLGQQQKKINGHGRNLHPIVHPSRAGPHIPSHPISVLTIPEDIPWSLIIHSLLFPGLLDCCFCVWYLIKKTLDKNDQTKTFRIQLRIYHNLSFGRFPEAFHSMISAKNGRWQVRQIRSARSTWNRRKSASHVANWLEDARRKSNQICLLLLSLIVSCNLIAGWSGIAQRAFNWSW